MSRDYKFRSEHIRAQQMARAKPKYPGWIWGLWGLGLGLCVSIAAYVEGRYPGAIISGTTIEADTPGTPIANNDAVATSDYEQAQVPKPTFKFEAYRLLRDMEVEVEAKPKPQRETLKTKASTELVTDAMTTTTAQRTETAPPVALKQNLTEPALAATKTIAQTVASPRPLLTKHQPTGATPIEDLIARAKVAQQYMLQVGSFSELAAADALRASLMLDGHDALIQTVSVNGDHVHRVRLGPYNKADAEQTKALLVLRQVQATMFRI